MSEMADDFSPLPDTVADQQFGWVHEVTTTQIGSALVADASEGDEVLYVSDAGMFDAEGGALILNGGVMGYVSSDPEEDTIVLSGPLDVTYEGEVDDTVAVWSNGTSAERLAMVEFSNGDGDDDPIPAVLSSGASGKLRNGDRGGRGEVVLLDMFQGQWRIVDVLGVEDAPVGEDEVDLSLPGPVEGLTVSSAAYVVGGGRYLALAHLEWDPVEIYGNGNPIDPENPLVAYEISYRPDASPTWSSIGTTTSAGALEFDHDNLQPGASVWYRVAGIDSKRRRGQWSDEVHVDLATDNTAPQKPSAPVLSTRLGVIRADWDGKADGGGPMDPDLAYVEIHESTSSGFTPVLGDANTIVERLTDAGFGLVADAPYGENRTFKIIAVDTSGNVSPVSDGATIATAPLVDTDLIGEIINGAHIVDGTITASDKIVANSITGALIQALAIETGHLKANAVTTDKLAVGSVVAGVIAADAVTSSKIKGDAIDGKTITGAVIQTAASGERVVVRNDGSGGIIETYSGVSGETSGFVNPAVRSDIFGRVASTLLVGTGTTPTYPVGAYVGMASGLDASNAALTLHGGTVLIDSWHTQIESVADITISAGGGAYPVNVEGILLAYQGLRVNPGGTEVLLTTGGHVIADGNGAFGGSLTNSGHGTTTDPVNSRITAGGLFLRVTSLRADKLDIQDITLDEARKILNVNGRTWVDRVAAEAYAAWLAWEPTTDGEQRPPLPYGHLRRIPGLVVDEVQDAGIPELVTSEDDDPNGLAYERIVAYLIPLVRHLWEHTFPEEGEA